MMNIQALKRAEMPNTLPMGCIIIRKEYAESHPEEVKLFLDEYKKSIEEVNSNVEESAKYVVSYGIIVMKQLQKRQYLNAVFTI